MRRWLLFASTLLIATAGAGGTALAATTPNALIPSVTTHPAKAPARIVAGHKTFTSAPKVLVKLAPRSAQPQAQARMLPQLTPNLTLTPTAKINVTYIGFPSYARAAFQAAVNTWQTQIHSVVPIDVVADWSDLTSQYSDPNILGAAGPTTFVENFTNAPKPNVAYPIALANAIAGSDQLPANVCNSDPANPNPSGAEITASFNSQPAVPWNFATTGSVPGNEVDFESVVLHELGHGLGFVGSYDVPDAAGTGIGDFGLTGTGQDPTIFDTFAADGSGNPLETTYANDTMALGNALRGADGGVEWDGTYGDAAAGGHPVLYAPNPFQEGSSFSHLDENTYPPSSGNALMTPALGAGEAERSVGPIVLGMFRDMGWPQSGSPSTAIGDYHVAAPMRLASTRTVTNAAPLNVQVAGVDGVPASGVTAVTVNIAVQRPSRPGYFSTLPGCSGAGLPDTQNFLAGQTRTMQATLPLSDTGQIRVSLTAVPAAPISGVVSVDLVGWYGSGGVSYHQLAAPKQALVRVVGPAGLDVPILGVAGIPTSGVTAVVLEAGVGFGNNRAALVVGPGGVNSIVPSVAYDVPEFTTNLVTVPVGTGAGAGKIRVRTSSGSVLTVLTAVGWYGPSSAGGQAFHSAGPAHLTSVARGQDVTISGLPGSTQVLLDVHLARPSAMSSLSAAPGGSPALALVQEFKANQPGSGTFVVTTNALGQVRLRLSSGEAWFYTDFQGWFST